MFEHNGRWRRISVSAAALVAMSLCVQAGAQTLDRVFSDPELASAMENANSDRDVMRQRPVKLDLELASGQPLVPLARFALNLFQDRTYTAVLDQFVQHTNRRYAWIGHLQEVDGSVVFMVRQGSAAGTVRIGENYFRIRFAGNGLHSVQEVDRSATPQEEPPFPIEVGSPGPMAREDVMFADDGSEIDVLFLYTTTARDNARGTSGIQSLIELGVTEANLAYQNSGVIHRIRAVNIQQVDYTESGNISTDLSRLKSNSDGYLDEVHALRDQYGADLVQLVVEGGCGVAYLMSGNNTNFAPYGFSVASRLCISPNYTLGHELGHNMGCNHAPFDPVGNGAYNYSFGYKDTIAGFRTVMSYSPGTRVLHFSNPTRMYKGAVTGVTNVQDNARSLNNVRATVANFRPSIGTEPLAEPDLTVDSVALVTPNPTEGDDVYFSAVVKNIGNAATPSNQSITLSVKVNGVTIDTAVFSNLAAGASVTVQTSSPWHATAGSKTLNVTADDPNQVAESDESNNSFVISFTVGEAPEPDLVIDSLQQSPTTPTVGETVHFVATVRNAGSVPTPSGQAVSVSFSVNGTVFTTVSTGPLEAGNSVTLSTNGGPGWVASVGEKTLTATADPSGNIAEELETNNSRSQNFTVIAPPLPEIASPTGLRIVIQKRPP